MKIDIASIEWKIINSTHYPDMHYTNYREFFNELNKKKDDTNIVFCQIPSNEKDMNLNDLYISKHLNYMIEYNVVKILDMWDNYEGDKTTFKLKMVNNNE